MDESRNVIRNIMVIGEVQLLKMKPFTVRPE
jgi:hypothetical protein